MDNTTKAKSKKKKNWVPGLLQLLILAAIIILMGVTVAGMQLENIESYMIFLCVIAAVVLGINLHELGHLVFGKISGYQLLAFQIGFLYWSKQNDRMKLTLRVHKGLAGSCAMLPPGGSLPLYRHALYFAGGIIGNLMAGLVFLLLPGWLPGLPDAWKLLFITVAGISLFLGLSNLLPFYSANNPSDGLILWNLLLKKPLGQKLLQYNQIAAQLAGGIRPRDIPMPGEAEGDAQSGMLKNMEIINRYFKALDADDLDKALQYADWMANSLGFFPPQMLPAVYYELCFMGCVTNDLEKARRYHEKAGKILKNDADINGLRIKAYYAYHVQNDKAAARQYCEKALAVAHKFPIRGQALMEETLVKKLDQMLGAGANDRSLDS